ncbi:Putative deoxyribonuclease TATDN2 [Psilocybe cubensis]|uniref:Metallo-dependent hydrolase n=2 Tax=Psilocybe cubensis TaxID=181762 RepID=A0A8H8CGJ2_PSICU|nr:Putative deoxyribonuclease TATDN2 [Psilocybe cubensis]KAH9474980.1 Putative deoxyribonuclease TATDN2 [Psilocybe cubensis]
MGKRKSSTPGEENLLLPTPPSTLPIVDTHTHVASTFDFYRGRYKEGKYQTVYEFIKAMYQGRNVEAVVDVWCEAPVNKTWKEFADAAADKEKWGGLEYWFVMGVHPHDAKSYTDEVENDILEAMAHPRCVGWGEMGLDYHYDNSPRDIQQAVFTRQLKQAVRLGKPLTIHTREADDDTERILKAEVPKDHKIHIHCFTDSPGFAQRLLDHFPNLYIGITGVITYSTNVDTSTVVQNMVAPPSEPLSTSPTSMRILLETDAPFMVPSNLYDDLPAIRGKKLPVCHTAMIPWTAKFVADITNKARLPPAPPIAAPADEDTAGIPQSVDITQPDSWDADIVMRVARDNARNVYGV